VRALRRVAWVADTTSIPAMLPSAPLTNRYATRAFVYWVGVRLLTGAAISLAGGDPLHLGVSSAMLLVLTSVGVGFADLHRRHERALLENLGVSSPAQLSFFALPALLGESALAVIVGALG
jgi:hypothetical protein